MAKPFKDIPSLHRLLESAPLESLKELLLNMDEGRYAACLAGVEWSVEDRDELLDRTRNQLLDRARELQADVAVPLERHAQRLLTLAEGRGREAIAKVAGQLRSKPDQVAAFRLQKDDYGRAIWLFVHQGALFEEAETLFYANHYRNYGRLYEAFELNAEGTVEFAWNTALKAALEARIKERLELAGPIATTHITVDDPHGDEGSSKRTVHFLIVRHAGPLSSVAEIKDDGGKKPLYFLPANEATLLFAPHEGVIEVFAESPGTRYQVAAAFAEIGLDHNLSDRPLTLRQYCLSRFLSSLRLDVPCIPGVDIESVAVVDVDARPENHRHCASLRVTADDDIEAVADALFGNYNLFRRAVAITRVVIAVRYARAGDTDSKTLNITLSDPNRCNLRSNRDPHQRDFGYRLLAHWGILRTVRRLSSAEEGAILPALLALYDQRVKEIARRFLEARGVAIDQLVDGGFLVLQGRLNSLDIELDDGRTQTVPVEPSGRPGVVMYRCPIEHRSVDMLRTQLDRFVVKHEWLEETILKTLRRHLRVVTFTRLDEDLIHLGDLSLGTENVPCYFARRLGDLRTLRRCDVQLRARHDAGIGLVLCAGNEHPPFLGANVVTPFADLLVAAGENEEAIDLPRLSSVYGHGKALARGGLTVDFVVDRKRTATLYLPGKPNLTVVGEKQILIVQRLYKAYRSGNPAVATKDLIDGTGVQSPSQAFRNWKDIVDVYIGQADKRGAWKLLV